MGFDSSQIFVGDEVVNLLDIAAVGRSMEGLGVAALGGSRGYSIDYMLYAGPPLMHRGS